MAKALMPSKPWTGLDCRPEDLVFLTASVLRGKYSAVAQWCIMSTNTTQVVEMLASRHRAGPFLASRLKGSAGWGALPESSRQRLQKSADLQAVATSDCLAHLGSLREVLDKAGCDYLVLKGPELGARFAGGAAARGYRDVDVLVVEQDRRRACAALEAAGYHRLSRWLLGAAVSSRFNHAVDYRQGNRLLDLHWCVSRAPGIRIKTEDLFARSVPFEIDGMAFRALCADDELAVLLISAFADIQRGYLRLQSFVDVANVVNQIPETEWSAFFEKQSKQRTEGMCRAVLGMVLSLFDLSSENPKLHALLSPLPSKAQALSVLLPSPGGRAAKRWALPHLPVNRMHYACWWGISLPFRVAASHHLLRRSVPS
jgi:hypothetical protein